MKARENNVEEFKNIKQALDESSIVAATDRFGMITYVNQKFCEISQYTYDELIGKDHRIINSGYHPKSFMKNLWKTIQSGNVWKGEICNRAKDGSLYWVDTTIVPFLDEDGAPYQYLAIRTDVTAHKSIEEELKKSINELYDLKFALDESSIVAVTDQKGMITYVNKKFCEISKYSEQELIGQDHRIINSGHHSKDFFKNLWKKIGTGNVWKGEIKNRAKDGTYYWVDTTIVPFLNKNGKPYQYLAIRSEITDRKRVEQELQQMMTRMLDVQEDERKRLSRELHDGIGQDLYSLLISTSRLKSEIEHPLLDQMYEEVSKVIEDIRSISWELRPSVLDDLGLIPAIRSFVNRLSEHSGITVHIENNLRQRLDIHVETAVYRIVQEALTNIRKYAGVEEASVLFLYEKPLLTIMIVDKGRGFSTKHNENGVGLFNMSERAKAVDGELRVFSEPGKGTKVIFSIEI